jgi:hypothetical protein
VHRPPGKLASPPKMSRDGFEEDAGDDAATTPEPKDR